MNRVFEVTRNMTWIDNYPLWNIKELKRTKDYDHGVVYLSDCGFASVIIVSDYPATKNGKSLFGAVSESSVIGHVLGWGASLIIEAINKQEANNIWRDELGKVQLT